MCFGNCYFATDKSPLLYSANQRSWFAIYKIGVLNVQRCKKVEKNKKNKKYNKNVTDMVIFLFLFRHNFIHIVFAPFF